MKTSELYKLRCRSAKWPAFVRSWDDIPSNSVSIVVDRTLARSLEPLSRFKRLKNLFVHGLREEDLAHVAAVSGLKRLLIWSLNASDLHGLSPLSQLESLGAYHAFKLKSFAGLQSLHSLRHIYFYHIPNVNSLAPLSGLTSLEEIILEQSWGTDKLLSFESLRPIRTLVRLRCLDLRGAKIADGSLKPIAFLPAIHHLFPCSYAFDIHELAYLAAKLNHQLAREDRLHPTLKLDRDDQFYVCKKCGAQQHKLVGKVGRKYRLLACPKCDNELIAERSAIFDSVKSKVSRRVR